MRSEDISTLNPMPTRDVVQDGALAAVPAGSANGTVLPGRPVRACTAILYLAAGDSVTYTISVEPPTGVPAEKVTVSGDDFALWPEELGPDTEIYITAIVGTPKFRWL